MLTNNSKLTFGLVVIAILIISLLANYYLIHRVDILSSKVVRIENNYKKPNMQVQTPKEFKQWLLDNGKDKIIDTLNKLIDIKLKPKNINSYHTITNNYKDTSITILYADSLYDGLYPIEYIDPKNCWGIKGFFHIPTRQFTIEEKLANDSIYMIDYFVRNKFLGLRIGKKVNYRETWSTCKGKIAETKITIDKKADN